MGNTEFIKHLKSAGSILYYEAQRSNKDGSGNTKGHKVRMLKMKQRINDTLLDFNQFLDDTYIDKFESSYPIKLFQLLKDYNNWLSSHP